MATSPRLGSSIAAQRPGATGHPPDAFVRRDDRLVRTGKTAMKRWTIAATAAGLALSLSSLTLAEDNQAGIPLAPADAAGPWTLEADGHAICTITLGKDKGPNGFNVSAPDSCGDALPTGLAAWEPTRDGMRFIGEDGAAMNYGRWSNSLFVAHRSTGVDVQLKRGGPGPA
jgi:hypothetical protein